MYKTLDSVPPVPDFTDFDLCLKLSLVTVGCVCFPVPRNKNVRKVLGPWRLALTEESLDAFGENASKADGFQFHLGSATKGKGGPRAKCAWDLGIFQMLKTISGDLTEFDRIIPWLWSHFQQSHEQLLWLGSERSHWQEWFLQEVAQWYPLSLGVLSLEY